MSQLPRDAVVRILQKLMAEAEDDVRSFASSPDYYKGRVSGIKTALDVLAMDEDELLPRVATDAD